MAKLLNKIHPKTEVNSLPMYEYTSGVLDLVKAALENDLPDTTIELPERCQCLFSGGGGAVHILVTDVNGEYIFDKVYKKFGWAQNTFVKFIDTICSQTSLIAGTQGQSVAAQSSDMLVDEAPKANNQVSQENPPDQGCHRREFATSKRYDNNASDAMFGAVIDTKFVNTTALEPLWKEKTIIVVYTAKFSEGVSVRIEQSEGAQLVKLNFGPNTIAREAGSILEAKQVACGMAKLLSARDY